MSTQIRGRHEVLRKGERRFNLAPLAQAVALTLAAGVVTAPAYAQRAFSPAWFASKGATQQTAMQTGKLANGMPASSLTSPQGQQQRANDQLKRSINNLNLAARGIAAQQSAQEAARRAAGLAPSDVPDGLTEGGLKVDTNSLTAGWLNAKDPTQTVANGHTTVDIQQTADKAILNWETFNVGRNTTVDFKQNADWAVLNRVNDPNARPSQILGQIKGDGTVMIVNRNGVVFDGTSQVNTRNLVAAAANISNTQFQNNGIYGADANTASLTDALGKVEVKAGARITTHESKSVTQGGGYVLLAGSEVHNTGEITTRKGQTQLAAGDSFLIRKGVGTDANTASTTRGNEISPRFVADSTAGKVSNSGLILSREGDITLAGRDVRQDGTAISTTTVNTRGTVHLLNAASDTLGKVTLGKDAITAVVLEDDGKTTALDSQRDALIKESTEKDLLRSQSASGAFDNLSILADRRDQSRIEIVSGGNVVFEGDSLTLATGGQIVSDAQGRSFVTDKAQLDVAGAVGVTVAMESNNVKVNVQGNELRDSPLNRDSGKLFNNDVWMDRRQLVLVPKGTGGYESDRWYTANGLLEVGGYLSNQGHGIGEWAAQGGTVLLGGSEVVTQAGSSVNLAGGTLDVQTGFINQTWLRGSDGRLYNLDKAPADMTFNGVYKGFESDHERWKVTEFFYNPLIGPQRRLENGYTVGRDAGQLIISTSSALLEGDIVADVFNGARQSRARDALADGYRQAQTAVAQAGGLSLGLYNGLGRSGAYAGDLTIGDFAGVPAEAGRLDAAWLNAQGLGRLSLAASGAIALTSDLLLADGGAIEFIAPHINLNADVTARGGSLSATNLLTVHEMVGGEVQTLTRQLLQSDASLISVGAPDRNVMLDLRGRWVNADLDPLATEKLARLNGGSVQLVGTGDVTLVSGSVIDVSSGGAVLTNGKTRGGTGGSVSLRAGESYGNSIGAGTLTLDGEVRGYGVNGGGTLQLQTGGSWVIGGKVLEVDGQLGAGEVALIDLELDQTLQLQSGEISPVNLVLEKTRFAAGERLDRDVRWQTLYGNAYSVPGGFQVGAAGWTLPPTMSVIAGGVTYSGSSTDPARRTVPAGSNITQIPSGASLPLGYVIATDVLPGGLPVLPYKYLLPAGSVVPADASVASLTLNPGQRLPAGTVFGQALAVRSPGTLVIDTPDAFGNSLLERGFSRYDINATHGLAVVGETTLAPRVPTLQFLGNAKAALNGDAGYEQALGLTLSPLFSEDPIKAKLTQRAGADLVLRSGLPRLSESSLIADLGSLYVGADARVSVDPGRDVLLESYGQITIEGHIEAPAGNIAVLNPRKHMDLGPGSLSIWIGERAVLDAAGRAQIAIDGRGRQYGLVLDGGHITLGSRGGLTTISGERPSSDAFVVVRPGALLDVSGAIGSVDESFILESGRIPAGSGVTRLVASHGGEIAMRSYNGIYLDGTLRGAGGGAGSAGGSLIVELESPVYGFPTSASGFPLPTFVPNHLRTARVLNVTQDVPGDRLAPTLGAGQYSSTLAVGHAGVGAAQIEAGGFDSAALSSRDVIAFNGAVALSVGGSLTLGQGKLVNTVEGAQVHLSAPYVLMDGHTAFTLQMPSNELFPTLGPDYARGGSLRIDGGLIDVRNRVAAEFDDLTLTSGSDLRFLAGTDTADYLPTRFTALANVGDLTLLAGQIYPASHAFVKVYAGVTMDLQTSAVDRVALSTLTIGRSDGAAGPLPYSVFGDITLAAAHIVQGGIVRAPLGSITLEGNGLIRLPDIPDFHFPTRVELLPGSITSVSAAGLLIPYGGTTDGVRYTIDGLAEGKEVPTFNVITGEREDTLAGGSTGVLTTGITLVASNVVSHDGSLVDLSGGGKLAGAAFVSGRGGSVDTLLYPRQKGGEVYALLPGTVTAPVAGSYYDSWKGSVPGIGQQVIVPEGVAGLPAGAYTLLPANYALLPGAYRVELGAQGAATSSRATATPDGSYVFNAATAIAGTAMHDAFARLVTLTPADVVRTWSQYNETSYADFQLAKAALTGAARPLLEDDGRFLELTLRGMTSIQDGGEATSEEPALVFDGLADFKAAKGGYGGTLLLTGEANNSSGDSLLVTGPGGPTTRSAAYWDGMQWAANAVTPIAAEAINAIGAPNLYIGGRPTRSGQFQKGSIVAVGKGGFEAITLTQGAVLQAGQIFLGTNDRSDTHRIVLEAGAGLSTLGWPASAPDSLLGVQFQIAGLVASNGWIDLAPLSGDIYSGTGLNSITLHDGAFLYADGTVGFTAKAIDIQGVPRLGARYLALSSSAFNVGNAETLAAARQGAAALAGLDLEQGFLAKLLRGDPVSGAPAVERLTFTAQNSFNFLGSVALDTYDSATGVSLLDEFIINSPAIYGLGTAQDAATLRTDTLIWKSNTRTIFDANYVASEVGLAPGAVNAGGPGTGLGTLDIQAREIVLGYPKVAAARNEIDFDRLALGFSTVNLAASDRIITTHRGNLSVYQSGPSPDTDFDAATYAGAGGTLNLIAPTVTGAAGSNFTYRVGGALNVRAPADAPASRDVTGELGAIINLMADRIDVSTAVVLPSGRLTMNAAHDITLSDGARIDMTGQRIDFFDTSRYSWGGELVAESAHGSIIQSEGASIDVSAKNSDAGRLQFTATNAAAGRVLLNGTLAGAGGASHEGGAIDIRAQRIGENSANLTGDFAALNSRLNGSGFSGSRSFALKQGNLSIGNELRAREVNVSVDGGSLTVNGTIDASGAKPGTIRLAARDDLTLAATSVLDAHGTQLQVDSYGQAIEAKNRGHVELTSSQGWLHLASGAKLDLSSPDGVERGKIELNTGRTGETSGDARIDASGPLDIEGAQSIALNAFWKYSPTDAAGTIVQNNGSGDVVNSTGAVGLDQIDTRSVQFMDAALGNTSLVTRTSGLSGYGKAYHLRPGVEINSEQTPSGDLTVVGDLDLSKYRYGRDADRDPSSTAYGAGEPLALAIRAAGDLTIRGSISDGFGSTVGTPPTYGVIASVAADPTGNFYNRGITYQLTVGRTVLLNRDWTVPSTWGLNSSSFPRDVAGRIYSAGEVIPAGTQLDRVVIRPQGNASEVSSLFSGITDPGTPTYFGTSPLAPMLAAGNRSASIRLSSGADLEAADKRSLQSSSALFGAGLLLLDRPQQQQDGSPMPSVIRTGTGDLEILAGGSLRQDSLFGIYTAGTQIAPDSGITTKPQTYIADHGGDLRIAAQSDLAGYVFADNNSPYYGNYSTGDWLTRTGDHATAQKATWSINFGQNIGGRWYGFAGMGTMGGGNVNVSVGGDAGVFNGMQESQTRTSGLVFAVGASGYVTSVDNAAGTVTGGLLKQYGGGDLNIRIAGRLNPGSIDSMVQGNELDGSFSNLRGNIDLRAAAIGSLALRYGVSQRNDPRPASPYQAAMSSVFGAPVLVLGDSSASLRALGDLALGSVGDAGQLSNSPPSTGESTGYGASWFSLWKESTGVNLFSAGGNLAPLHQAEITATRAWGGGAAYSYTVLPANFEAVAASGSLYYGQSRRIELAPASAGSLTMLARESIQGAGTYTGGYFPEQSASININVSGAPWGPNDIPNPFKPATQASPEGLRNFRTFQSGTSGDVPRNAGEPIRIYAVNGDVTNVLLGEHLTSFANAPVNWYVAAAQPVRVQAGGDIVNFGSGTTYDGFSPSVILNRDLNDVSIISAGGNIYYLNVLVGGPGSLEVTAGGNLYQGKYGGITSIGPIVEGDIRPGASIAVQVGAGATGPNWDALASLYLNPANQADTRPGSPLADQPGKVARTYDEDLKGWLKERYGYEAGSASEALAYFNGLASEQQRIFLRSVYYAELKAGGREYNDMDGPRLGSYLRGRQAIAALFPEKDAGGNSIERSGSYTAFGASGIQTLFGGDIQVLAPAGQIVVGVTGEVPPASSGLITQGDGNIQLYSEGSVLLGLSRIMTTFGGDILAWSAKGDINAGRGSKTTLVYTPPKRVYDAYGNVTLSPDVPSTGAGIATLNPLPEVPPGDVDLIAPLGTIDVGEAGIRVSGNVNLAALQVVNAANIQVKGEATGIPTVAAVNVAALTNASAAASQAAGAAQDVMQRERASARQNLPSIFTVRVLGFGNEPLEVVPSPSAALRPDSQTELRYDKSSVVQVVGEKGRLYPEQAGYLTEGQRQRLRADR